MSVVIYKIKGNEVFYTDETELSSEHIYIIVDKLVKRPRIWVWSGRNANIRERYIAGVSATKIKSKERLYGASIEVVEEGNEPENFPQLKTVPVEEKSKEELAAPLDFKSLEMTPPAASAEAELAEEGARAEELATQAAAEREAALEAARAASVEAKPVAAVMAATPGSGVAEAAAEGVETAPALPPKARPTDRLFRQKVLSLLRDLSRDLELAKMKVEAFLADLK
ncbi:MAG: hypothetical protein Kow0069_23490 [Promethearchaeota archaeon]